MSEAARGRTARPRTGRPRARPAQRRSPRCHAGDDVCGICRMNFDGCPPDGKYPGDDSPVVWGVCTHAFHLQCINRCAKAPGARLPRAMLHWCMPACLG